MFGGFFKKSKKKKNKEVKEEEEKLPDEEVIVVKKRNIPVSPYITPYPFTECPPKILTAYASSVYNANEGRLLTIEMEKVNTHYYSCSTNIIHVCVILLLLLMLYLVLTFLFALLKCLIRFVSPSCHAE